MNVWDYIKNFQTTKKWDKIIVHHSLTYDGQTVDWEAIKNYHININGWRNIGYHLGIEYIGSHLVLQIGRPLDEIGAHTLGQNTKAIGICVVGNFDRIIPTEQHYFLVASICRELMRKFDIPIQNILPHFAFADKTCPGINFNIPILRKHIRN